MSTRSFHPSRWALFVMMLLQGIMIFSSRLTYGLAQDIDATVRSQPAEVSREPTTKQPMKQPMIVAHRGASADAPENTLPAFQLGWDQNADAIEGDFFLTLDKQIVALHDSSTERTSGTAWDVRKKTAAELRTLEVGRWKHHDFVNVRIPTLAEVVQTIPVGKKLFLEVKDSPRFVPVLKQQLTSEPALASLSLEQLVIIAFDAEVIAASKRELPEVKAFWLTGFKADAQTGKISPSLAEILSTLQTINADGLDCQAADHIDHSYVDQIRAAGYQFHVWTIDDPAIAKRFAEFGVDSITTNVPQIIRHQLTLPTANPSR
ncbi:MAG: glycerophosphodiester phosphodiesterase family protein [Pirellulaceae bacterium]|nr:glycerophosphodiester phosphodiesterase family protein [Pirellulaceae bacterium]